ncbi:AraC family transcriptional regulator [Paenibacillus hodogayensis]
MNGGGIHENFNQFFDNLGVSGSSSETNGFVRLRPQLGNGYMLRLVPRDDMSVAIANVTFSRRFGMPLETDVPMVELNYCLQGSRELQVGGSTYEYARGDCTLQFMKPGEARFWFKENEPWHMLGIGIPVSAFQRFLGKDGEAGSADFSRILGRSAFRLFREAISPAAGVIVERLLQASQTPGMRNIETECCVLELLSMAFRSFLAEDPPAHPNLSRSDVDKIRQARDMMMERMTDPPSLIGLSRLIGLNDYKLKVGFKAVYGTTVFGYLRDKRLEKAFLLLQQGQMNVNEIACAVGYANASYFAEAFRDKYGFNPGQFRP